MSTPEYNRRHYGIVADEGIAPRMTNPENLDRRLSGNNGIYVDSSETITIDKTPPKPATTVALIATPVETAQLNTWEKGTTSLKASGIKIVRTADVMAIPKDTSNIQIDVK